MDKWRPRSDERGGIAVAKVAIVVPSDTETSADSARVANALTTAYEFKEAEEGVMLIFTGAGPSGSESSPTPIIVSTERSTW
jgi:electron transfer flavoprotein alpha/beta subunit